MGENCIVTTDPDMNLTAGTALQNQKYVIEKLLHQSDFGVTYQVQHAYLGKPVVLQTLNDSLRQRDDFAQLQQQFLTKVRSLAQKTIANARVLDCFEENGMPFVVFELAPGRMPPLLSDWLMIAPHTALPVPPAETPDLPLTAAPTLSALDSAEETLPPAPASPTALPSQTASPSLSMPVSTAMATQFVRVPPPSTPSKIWMPLSLLFVSMFGGILGAGFGLSVRLAPTAQTGENPSKLTSRLFSREQSFPSGTEWPISETPQIFTADPTPIEEPVYRVNPTLENYPQPSFQPLPETQVQEPVVLPSPAETLKTGSSTKPNFQPDPAIPVPPITDGPDVTTLTPPEAFDVPAPPAAEPEILPLSPIPDLPASIVPNVSVPEAAPVAPDLPAKQPPVIKQ